MIIGDIKEGLVLDHIQAGMGMKLYNYLKLSEKNCQIAIIENATSDKYGKKDILKIAEKIDIDYDVLGAVDPHITINVIEGGKRVKKIHPPLPDEFEGIFNCKNPRCITTIEQELPQRFKLTDREKGTYRCIYCETKLKR